MEQFHDGHLVWLRSSELGTYLHADDDGQGASLHRRRASLNAAWAVHVYHGDGGMYVLLRSAAYGRYLAATNTPAPRGHRGFHVAQRNYDQPEVEAIMWVALGFGAEVVLRNVNGRYLRANGRYCRWNKGVSVEPFTKRSTMMQWIVDPIPLLPGMPALPAPAPIRAGFLGNLSLVMFGRWVPAPLKLIRFVLANDDGIYNEEGWNAFQFRGALQGFGSIATTRFVAISGISWQ